jgi:hypothetical protein
MPERLKDVIMEPAIECSDEVGVTHRANAAIFHNPFSDFTSGILSEREDSDTAKWVRPFGELVRGLNANDFRFATPWARSKVTRDSKTMIDEI